MSCDTHRALAAATNAILLASSCHQRASAYCNGVSAHGNGLSEIAGHPQTAGDNEGNVLGAYRVKIFTCSSKSVNSGHTGGLTQQEGAGASATATAINSNKIRLRINTVLQLTFNATSSDLNADGTTIGLLPEHGYHSLQVLAAVNLGEFGRAVNVLAYAEATDSSDFWRNLFAGEVTAHTGLSTLANLDFDSISLHQVFFGYAIFIRDVLKNKFFRSGLLLGHDTALTAFFHTAGHGGSLGQGDFRFARQSTKGHVRNEDGVFRYQRPFSVLAQYYGRAHLFLVQQRRRIQLGT